jgi:hypothetical protein
MRSLLVRFSTFIERRAAFARCPLSSADAVLSCVVAANGGGERALLFPILDTPD